jgi:hypothetical protein
VTSGARRRPTLGDIAELAALVARQGECNDWKIVNMSTSVLDD